MAYKKLSEATLVESVAEEATMLIEENDEIKRASVKDTMEKYGFSAGGGGGCDIEVVRVDFDNNVSTNLTYEKIAEGFANNTLPYVLILSKGAPDIYFIVVEHVLFDQYDNIYKFVTTSGYNLEFNAEGGIRFYSVD